MHLRRPADWRSLASLPAFAAVLAALYWPAVSLQGVFYVGDIYRLNYPARAVYAAGLRAGHIPLWTPGALGGYPILAEGQTGALYPLNLLLYRWLPLPAAINYSALLSFLIAGSGVFLYTRSLGLRRFPAFLAGCAFMIGGFMPAHLTHLNMQAAVAWLPFLLWAVERATRSGRWQAWALVSLIFGLQGLAGHPQMSLLSALLAGGAALVGPFRGAAGLSVRRQAGQVALCGLALVAGAGVAMAQWAPTVELTRLSQRGGGLDYYFFTSFSMAPGDWLNMVSPFPRGNPYPATPQELVGYVGMLPLALAALALVRRRDRLAAFWTAVAGLAVFLGLGRWNPAYRLLAHVPLMNMFRVPARYLLWLDLAIAILAAAAADSLLGLARAGEIRWRALAPGAGLGLAAIAALWTSRLPLDGLLLGWRWLPALWLLASAALLLSLRWRPPARLWSILAAGLLLADLGAFSGVCNRTYNDLMPPAEFLRPPDALRVLEVGAQPYRVYTVEKIGLPLPVMRESLYPNMQLLHGVESVSAYFPLLPGWERWLAESTDPRLADLLGVRYVLIPQVPPGDDAAEAYDTEDPFAPSIVGRSFDLPAPQVAAVEVEGYLSCSAELPDGQPVAEIILRGGDGQESTWTLRAGEDLAEWAYSRDDLQGVIRHRLPQGIARTWPARSGLPPRDHLGRTYLARHSLPQPVDALQVEVRPLIPSAHLRLERLRLIDPQGRAQLLSALVGEGDHILVYRSPEVAIYRNEAPGPRAFLVHRARVAPSEEEARRAVTAPGFNPGEEVILQKGGELATEGSPLDRVAVEAEEPEYVRLRATAGTAAYLVLADSYYPGWEARLDGQPAAIRQADAALRAVALPPGEHVVEFSFRPRTWRYGLPISGLSAAALLGVALRDFKRLLIDL